MKKWWVNKTTRTKPCAPRVRFPSIVDPSRPLRCFLTPIHNGSVPSTGARWVQGIVAALFTFPYTITPMAGTVVWFEDTWCHQGSSLLVIDIWVVSKRRVVSSSHSGWGATVMDFGWSTQCNGLCEIQRTCCIFCGHSTLGFCHICSHTANRPRPCIRGPTIVRASPPTAIHSTALVMVGGSQSTDPQSSHIGCLKSPIVCMQGLHSCTSQL